MGRSRKNATTAAKSGAPYYGYTVVLLPVFEAEVSRVSGKPKKNGRIGLPTAHKLQGYQVSVPALPGLITYGRTKAEARSRLRTQSVARTIHFRLPTERLNKEP
jgi:hypothetical protein